MKLTQEEKNQRIADVVGTGNLWHILKRGYYFRPDAHGYTSNKDEAWKVSEEEAKKWESKPKGYPDDWVTIVKAEPPDYFNDLNTCHEMEKLLTDDQWRPFLNRLENVTGATGYNTWWECIQCAVHAISAHRAESFGLTLNLWETEQ